MSFDYSIPARGPILNEISFGDGPKLVTRASLGVNLDYKLTDRIVLSLRTSTSHLDDGISTSRAAVAW
jgi:hypothetical protein